MVEPPVNVCDGGFTGQRFGKHVTIGSQTEEPQENHPRQPKRLVALQIFFPPCQNRLVVWGVAVN